MEPDKAAHKQWSRGDLEAVPTCPACGSSLRNDVSLRRRDDYAVMADEWTMVQCASCESLYLDPRPDAMSLPRAYADYYTHTAESDAVPMSGGRGLAWRFIHGYLNRRFGMRRSPSSRFGYVLLGLIEPLRLKLDYYGRHLDRSRFPSPGSLLDIGCGNGAFVQRAAEMGWHAQGVEPDRAAVDVCKRAGLDVLEGDAFHPALVEGTFDVITMSHVLEHVSDPSALLQRAHQLLKPGGLLWVAIPNTRSIGTRLFGRAWINLHMPLHLCIPSREQLDKLLHKNRFHNIRHLRRGQHTKFHWRESQRVAVQQDIAVPNKAILSGSSIVADLVAALSSRWAEEALVIAQKTRQAR